MTASDPSAAAPLHELIARRAGSCADALAVVDGERELTYGELDRGANRLAHLLLRAGAGPHAPVAVCLHRGVHLAVALLAVWKTGAAYVPLDPGHPRARTAAVLADTGATVVVTEAEYAERTGATGPRTVTLDPALTVLDGLPDTGPAVPVTGLHPAYVLYTSGSTGRPRAWWSPTPASPTGWAGGCVPTDWARRPGPAEDAADLRRGRLGDLRAAGQRRHRGARAAGAERDPAPCWCVGRSPSTRHGAAGRAVGAAGAGRRAGLGRTARTCGLLICGGEQLHAELVQRFLRAG